MFKQHRKGQQQYGKRIGSAMLSVSMLILIASGGMAASAYAADTYTITYDGNGPVCFENGAQTYEVDVNNTEDAIIISPDITEPLAASSIHPIVFNGNGGTIEGQAEYNQEVAGYVTTTVFDSWNTAKDGNGDSYKPEDKYTKKESVTLYAQWKDTARLSTFPTPIAVRDGYVMEGWFTQAEGGDKVANGGEAVTEEVLNTLEAAQRLYAHWTAAPITSYSVKFFSGDVLISEQQVAAGSAATAPAAPQAPVGKVFAGWDKDFSNVTGNLEIHAVFAAPSGTIAATGDMAGTGLMGIIAISIVLAAGLAVVRKKQ